MLQEKTFLSLPVASNFVHVCIACFTESLKFGFVTVKTFYAITHIEIVCVHSHNQDISMIFKDFMLQYITVLFKSVTEVKPLCFCVLYDVKHFCM